MIRLPIGYPVIYGGLQYRWFQITDGVTSYPNGSTTLEIVAYSTADASEQWSSGAVDARSTVFDGWDTWLSQSDSEGIHTWADWPYSGGIDVFANPRSLLIGNLFIVDTLHGVVIAWNLDSREEVWRIDRSVAEEKFEFLRILNANSNYLVCSCYRQILQDCIVESLDHLDFSNFPSAWEDPETVEKTVQDIAEGHSVQHLVMSFSLDGDTDPTYLAEYLLPEREDEEAEVCGNSRWVEIVVKDSTREEEDLIGASLAEWIGSESALGPTPAYHEIGQGDGTQDLLGTGDPGPSLQVGTNQSIAASVEDGYYLSRDSIFERLVGHYVMFEEVDETIPAEGDWGSKIIASSEFEANYEWVGSIARYDLPVFGATEKRWWINAEVVTAPNFVIESNLLGYDSSGEPTAKGFLKQQELLSAEIASAEWAYTADAADTWSDAIAPTELVDPSENIGNNGGGLQENSVAWATIAALASDAPSHVGSTGVAHVVANQYLYGIYRKATEYYTYTRSIDGWFDLGKSAVNADCIVFAPAYRSDEEGDGVFLCLDLETMTVRWETAIDQSTDSTNPVLTNSQVLAALYGADTSSRIVALNIDTGEIETTVALPYDVDADSEAVIVDGAFYCEADEKLYKSTLV